MRNDHLSAKLAFRAPHRFCENQEMGQVSKRCFCAFCRSERIVYRKRHISALDVGLSAAASALLSFIVWQDADPRMVVFFVLGLGLAELFITVRWRLSISCPHCGFDPVLYKRKPELAATRVRDHYARRSLDPMFAFAPLPRLPVIVKKADEAGKFPLKSQSSTLVASASSNGETSKATPVTPSPLMKGVAAPSQRLPARGEASQ